ncbi:hypothetical protein L0U85_04925 [Glycomyces sp. L485]|nr:hypothetical protein [Glycomyces sp. L485]MCH7230207.1 hypothetical protein [Glycomyces sp. L485]
MPDQVGYQLLLCPFVGHPRDEGVPQLARGPVPLHFCKLHHGLEVAADVAGVLHGVVAGAEDVDDVLVLVAVALAVLDLFGVVFGEDPDHVLRQRDRAAALLSLGVAADPYGAPDLDVRS